MSGFALLQVGLFGGQLDELDSVQITIMPTVYSRSGLDNEKQSDSRAPIWAGWKFDTFFTSPGVTPNALSPRQSLPRPYSRRTGEDFEILLLKQTGPPRWANLSADEWDEHWRKVPLRLCLTCRRGNDDPWYVYQSVWVERSDAPITTTVGISDTSSRAQEVPTAEATEDDQGITLPQVAGMVAVPLACH